MLIEECKVNQRVVSVHHPNPQTVYKIIEVNPANGSVDVEAVESKNGCYNGNKQIRC